MPVTKNTSVRTGLLVGTLTGALLGALVSWVLASAASKDRKTEPPGVMAYFQLIIAIIFLAKQAGDLVVGRSKKV
jgi:hypothetical protein